MTSVRGFAMRILVAIAVMMTAGTLVFPAIGQTAKTLIWMGGTMAPALYDPASVGDNLVQDDIFNNVDKSIKEQYPRTLGLGTFPYTEPYDNSVDEGSDNLVATIKSERASDPTVVIVVPSISQGSDAASIAIRKLEAENFDTRGIILVTEGNPSNNVGGLRTALPFGYVPGLGVTLGGDTTPQYTPVIQMRKQYDLVADRPQFFNPISFANAGLAFLQGGHEYYGPLYGPTHIVTTNSNGLITDVFVPWEGIVPLLKPLEMLGVPTAILEAINDPFKDLIELGYDRSYYGQPGMYPNEPVRMGLFPPPSLLVQGLVKFVVDCVASVQKLIALAVPPVQNNIVVAPAIAVPSSQRMVSTETKHTVQPETATVSPPDNSSDPNSQMVARPQSQQRESINDSSGGVDADSASSVVPTSASVPEVQAEQPVISEPIQARETSSVSSDQTPDNATPPGGNMLSKSEDPDKKKPEKPADKEPSKDKMTSTAANSPTSDSRTTSSNQSSSDGSSSQSSASAGSSSSSSSNKSGGSE
ncbi:MAG: hypothetical protein JWN75_175 [Candidatus Saccharibacteria bacterium]|nr:hypothetical protein [Candidatus Saccharibacteria bacterium]